MTVHVVFETHSTSEDNEAGIATGWLPGRRQAIDRVSGFLRELAGERDGERMLVIGHSATRFALDVVANGRRLEDLIAEPFDWQPGWSTGL